MTTRQPVERGARVDVKAAFGERLPHWARWASAPVGRAIGLDAAMADWDGVSHLQGLEFIDAYLEGLDITIEASVDPGADWSEPGPLVIVANHHLGLLDALVSMSVALPRRPDSKGLANRLLSILPQVASIMIPVPPPSAGSAAVSEVRPVVTHVSSGHALAVCPAGQVADRKPDGSVSDRPWSTKLGRIIQHARADVATISIEGRSSTRFYAARAIHFRLGTTMLMREFVSQRGRTVPVHVGRRIPFEELAPLTDPAGLMAVLRDATYKPLAR